MLLIRAFQNSLMRKLNDMKWLVDIRFIKINYSGLPPIGYKVQWSMNSTMRKYIINDF